jgi:hypothetical protein
MPLNKPYSKVRIGKVGPIHLLFRMASLLQNMPLEKSNETIGRWWGGFKVKWNTSAFALCKARATTWMNQAALYGGIFCNLPPILLFVKRK